MNYLVVEWGNEKAIEFSEALSERLEWLAGSPERGDRVQGYTDYYSYPFSKYRLYYWYDEEELLFAEMIDMRSAQSQR